MRQKMKYLKRITGMLLAFLAVFHAARENVWADSYTYSIYDEIIPAPDAYEWEMAVKAEQLGIDGIRSLTDLFYRNGKIYIAMSGKIVVTDEEFHTLFQINSYYKEGVEINISAPKCIYVTEEEEIYITEQEKGLIVQFDAEGRFIREIGNPGIIGLEQIKYAPVKVAVDPTGRIYVKAQSVYEGIIELDPEGNFNRFVGANRVTPSILDQFYRLIASEEQISRMVLWLPTDYSDIAFDKDGFLMAVVNDITAARPVRRLNANGADIMPSFDRITPPKGDYTPSGGGSSALTAIAASEDGRFAVIDSSRSRIFVYSQDGILAYVLGGSGKTEGFLNSPVDVHFMKDKILVADLVSASIEVYKPTEYGELMNQGLKYQSMYDYETAAFYWEKVYMIHPGNILANLGLGKYQLRAGNYTESAEHFKLTGERRLYSSAFEKVREAYLETHLGNFIIVCMVILFVLFLLKRWLKYLNRRGSFNKKWMVQVLKKIKSAVFTWPFYVLRSPFKAFDDVKYDGAGSTKFSFLILVLFAWMNLIRTKYSGFILNSGNVDEINVVMVLISSVIPYIVFIFANWAAGTLIDGKGNMKMIFKVNMYALYPAVYMYGIGTILSRVVLFDEAAFANFFFTAPFIIYLFYAFIGLLMVHQYSFTKGIGSILLSFAGMAVIIFVVMLLLTLVSGFTSDMAAILDEITLFF